MEYLIHILILCNIYILFASSLNLELGYTGLYNFGHVGFFGIGAYTSALLTLSGYPVWCGMIAAILVAGAAGALFAYPALRLTGDYFGIAALSFGEMVRLVLLNERWLTRGPMGLPGIPRPELIADSGNLAYLLFCLVVVGTSMLVLAGVITSPFGRTLRLIREDEHVARAFGKNVLSFKVRCMGIGSALAGLAGALFAHYMGYISPGDFTLQLTILVLLCVVLGGRSTLFGPVLGAVLVIAFGEMLRFLPLPAAWTPIMAHVQNMIFGLLLVVLMLRRPQGLLTETGLLRRT
jgi:branched-chain amino acid transport system permease protein